MGKVVKKKRPRSSACDVPAIPKVKKPERDNHAKAAPQKRTIAAAYPVPEYDTGLLLSQEMARYCSALCTLGVDLQFAMLALAAQAASLVQENIRVSFNGGCEYSAGTLVAFVGDHARCSPYTKLLRDVSERLYPALLQQAATLQGHPHGCYFIPHSMEKYSGWLDKLSKCAFSISDEDYCSLLSSSFETRGQRNQEILVIDCARNPPVRSVRGAHLIDNEIEVLGKIFARIFYQKLPAYMAEREAMSEPFEYLTLEMFLDAEAERLFAEYYSVTYRSDCESFQMNEQSPIYRPPLLKLAALYQLIATPESRVVTASAMRLAIAVGRANWWTRASLSPEIAANQCAG